MITMEQLEQLEGRIIKALELISDLRLENSHLESEVERLKSSNDQLKLVAEEKTNAASLMQRELEDARTELERLRGKEAGLEEKLTEIISRLDDVKNPSGTAGASVAAAVSQPEPVAQPVFEPEPIVTEPEPQAPVEPVKTAPEPPKSQPESVPSADISLDEDTGEDEIVLLEDEEDEEVIIMDEEPEENITPEPVPEEPAKKNVEEKKEQDEEKKESQEEEVSLESEEAGPSDEDFVIEEDDEDVLGVFQDDEDDDLLIVDEDDK